MVDAQQEVPPGEEVVVAVRVPVMEPVVPGHEPEIARREQGTQERWCLARGPLVAHVDVGMDELGHQRHGEEGQRGSGREPRPPSQHAARNTGNVGAT